MILVEGHYIGWLVPTDQTAHLASLVSVSYDMLREMWDSLRRFDAFCARIKSVTWE